MDEPIVEFGAAIGLKAAIRRFLQLQQQSCPGTIEFLGNEEVEGGLRKRPERRGEVAQERRLMNDLISAQLLLAFVYFENSFRTPDLAQ